MPERPHKVLIANRGEIAVRIIRACKELGLATVAVFTEADRQSGHVRMADQAFHLSRGHLAALDLVALAQEAAADAIHPGYGFLAENADFAKAVTEAGLVWIGPHHRAIAQLGSKTGARRIAQAAGVPLVPGTLEPVEDVSVALEFGRAQGWPIAIKAALGGGGKGFVVAEGPSEVADALAKAQREGAAYFASSEVYLEKYLPQPRHIEVQVLADKAGNTITLGERECSVQRRHQKLLEECPAPGLADQVRDQMCQAAVRLAQAVDYDSVGTVEFLVSQGRFYFLEMNTRIQVEHTITEAVYHCDLVKEQIKIALGLALAPELALRQPRGWALQCRINAEDPARNFRPCPGVITRYRRPAGPGIRVDDASIEAGWEISPEFDSLIAKIIAWGSDRQEAIARMRRALDETEIAGLATTIPFHRLALTRAAFLAGNVSTHFVGEVITTEDLATMAAESSATKPSGLPVTGKSGPAGDRDLGPFREFEVEVGSQRFAVKVAERDGRPPAALRRSPAAGRPRSMVSTVEKQAASGVVTAPMHATVQRVLISAGAIVEAGQTLLVLEAMKMETEIPSPLSGRVAELQVAPGETVEGGAVLAVVAGPEG